MRRGRCQYPVNIMVRADSRLRDEAGAALRKQGTTVAAFVRDQLRAVVAQAEGRPS